MGRGGLVDEGAAATDIILHMGSLPHRDGKLIFPRHTKRRVQVAKDIWLGPIRIRQAILRACELRGENVLRPFHNVPAHFGLFRTNAPKPHDRYAFDDDRRLRTALALSRLVRPTSTGLEYAVRLVRVPNLRREIIPFDSRGLGATAHVFDKDNDCLWDEDAKELTALLAAFKPKSLPNRVSAAMWHHEVSAGLYYVEMKLPQLVTGLESLVHTDDRELGKKFRMGSTDQFVERLFRLRQFVPSLRWTKAQLLDFYDHRSQLVHGRGGGHLVLTAKGRATVLAVELGYREVVKRCIHSKHVAEIFESESSVRTALGTV